MSCSKRPPPGQREPLLSVFSDGNAIPLIMTVDWIIARARSGVNVMSDMLVAILLDAGRVTPAIAPVAVQHQSGAAPPAESQVS